MRLVSLRGHFSTVKSSVVQIVVLFGRRKRLFYANTKIAVVNSSASLALTAIIEFGSKCLLVVFVRQ